VNKEKEDADPSEHSPPRSRTQLQAQLQLQSLIAVPNSQFPVRAVAVPWVLHFQGKPPADQFNIQITHSPLDPFIFSRSAISLWLLACCDSLHGCFRARWIIMGSC
ncbi:hypothetical protein T310_8583, partial [Rasamsonia emersonii CBS 393.64]